MDKLGPPRAGQLLIAADPGKGGFFDRSVVLILEHNESGTLGVVLNRVSEMDVPSPLADWAPLLSPPAVPFEGGPVSEQAVVALAQLANAQAGPPGWKPLFDDVGIVDLDTPVELVEGAFAHVRMYVGLAGWEGGQLEGELIRGFWVRTKARSEEVFGLPTGLWRRVLRRLGGASARWSTWTGTPMFN
ncbi:YqgE/AlgH family protein [Tessaracoccus oleiagri]|uniref:Putative transcriptional regulator n=1 Tax=Tessaracoccus oleiagri TaxID=686624 RepID=A0A1G9MMG4_9ACTN|nr:YqgE/AlgH family protein [Tessaracoccus oleiagri]SDL75472.1 putative transcriptional regulator [Tessaracoccus oleiagri]